MKKWKFMPYLKRNFQFVSTVNFKAYINRPILCSLYILELKGWRGVITIYVLLWSPYVFSQGSKIISVEYKMLLWQFALWTKNLQLYPILTYTYPALCCKCLGSFAFLWCKMLMFWRAGMREGGKPLPPAFQYLIFMV